jgi:hypothetical protein
VTDDFGKQSSGIVQQLAIGTAGVAMASLVDNDPMVALTASSAAWGAVEYFKTKASMPTSAIQAAEYSALFEEFRKLGERVALLEKKDRQDALAKQVVFSRFAKDVSEAATTEKREALVHATAYQFDPSRGSPATRDYWLRKVRSASDAELALVLLASKKCLAFFGAQRLVEMPSDSTTIGPPPSLKIPETDMLTFASLARQMVQGGGPGALLKSGAHVNIQVSRGTSSSVQKLELTSDGEIFVSFCNGD